MFGDLFGMHFREILPGDESYQAVVRPYLEYSAVREREAKLGVFFVSDMGLTQKPLGYLVLDLEGRVGKPPGAACMAFRNVCACFFLVELGTLPTDIKPSINLKASTV